MIRKSLAQVISEPGFWMCIFTVLIVLIVMWPGSGMGQEPKRVIDKRIGINVIPYIEFKEPGKYSISRVGNGNSDCYVLKVQRKYEVPHPTKAGKTETRKAYSYITVTEKGIFYTWERFDQDRTVLSPIVEEESKPIEGDKGKK